MIKSLSEQVFHGGGAVGDPVCAAAVAMVAVGLHSDRSGERRWHTLSPAFAGQCR